MEPLLSRISEQGYITKSFGRTVQVLPMGTKAPKDETTKGEYQNNMKAHISGNVFHKLVVLEGLVEPTRPVKVVHTA